MKTAIAEVHELVHSLCGDHSLTVRQYLSHDLKVLAKLLERGDEHFSPERLIAIALFWKYRYAISSANKRDTSEFRVNRVLGMAVFERMEGELPAVEIAPKIPPYGAAVMQDTCGDLVRLWTDGRHMRMFCDKTDMEFTREQAGQLAEAIRRLVSRADLEGGER